MADKIKINMLSGEGTRTIEVEFPNDDQWVKRSRSRSIIVRQLGRGESKTEVVGGEEADVALLEAISGETNFEPAEATLVINQLAEATVEDVVRDGEGFHVRIRTVGGQMSEHVCKVPTAKQVKDFRAAFSYPVDLPYNKIRISINIRAAGDLFDAICQATDIPIIHKVAIVSAVCGEFDRMLEPSYESF